MVPVVIVIVIVPVPVVIAVIAIMFMVVMVIMVIAGVIVVLVPALVQALVVASFFAFVLADLMTLLPFAMFAARMLPFPRASALPVAIVIAIAVASPARFRAVRGRWCGSAIPAAAPPSAAASIGSYPAIGRIPRNVVMAVHILHPAFHAAHFALVVGRLIRLPTRVVTVEALLIAY